MTISWIHIKDIRYIKNFSSVFGDNFFHFVWFPEQCFRFFRKIMSLPETIKFIRIKC